MMDLSEQRFFQSYVTLKHPTIWRLFPSCVYPQFLDEHQEKEHKGRKSSQEPPGPVVKRVGQGVVCDNRERLLALNLKVVQVHPWEVLYYLVSVGHNCGLAYANFTLLCEHLLKRKHGISESHDQSMEKWKHTEPTIPLIIV